MAATKRTKKTTDAWKAKKWYTIVAPKMFDERAIGETLADDPQKIVGRTVGVTLRDLTGNSAQQHIRVELQVVDVKGARLNTKIQGQSIEEGFIQRQIKRRRSLINTILEAKTKDGVRLQSTILAYSGKHMNNSVKMAVRRSIMDGYAAKIPERNFEQAFQDILFGKISAELHKTAKKVYPVSKVEILKTEVIDLPEIMYQAAPAVEGAEAAPMEEPQPAEIIAPVTEAAAEGEEKKPKKHASKKKAAEGEEAAADAPAKEKPKKKAKEEKKDE